MMVGSTVDLFLRTAFNQSLLDGEETLTGSVSIRTVAASAIVMSAVVGALIGVLDRNEE